MKNYTTRWRSDWIPDSVEALNQAVNRERENSVRMSLVFMEDGAYNRYEDMSTNATTLQNPLGDGADVTGGLEDVHGTYHVLVGGEFSNPNSPDDGAPAGHMTSVPTAAFDPIFWFHHW